MSSISINIESCLMLKSSRSIKYFTSTSFSVSMNVWNSLMIIWSWAMFMFVKSCRESLRFVGGTCMPTLSSVWCTSFVIGHIPCFWRSIWWVNIVWLVKSRFRWREITNLPPFAYEPCLWLEPMPCELQSADELVAWRSCCHLDLLVVLKLVLLVVQLFDESFFIDCTIWHEID